MLDSAVIAKISEIIQGQKCGCGRPAQHFRYTTAKGDLFYCIACFPDSKPIPLETRPHRYFGPPVDELVECKEVLT